MCVLYSICTVTAADVSLLQATILEQVLVHVSECHSICQQIGTRTNDPGDPTASILCMYEYEAKHWLGRSDSETILDQLTSQPCPDPKTFETLAGQLCNHDNSVCVP